MSNGPFYDAAAVATHDMMLEEWGEEFCPIASCWICQERREVIKENEARPTMLMRLREKLAGGTT